MSHRIVTNDAHDANEHRWLFRRLLTEVTARSFIAHSAATLARFEEAAAKAGASWTVIRSSPAIPGGVEVERRGGEAKATRRPLAGAERRLRGH